MSRSKGRGESKVRFGRLGATLGFVCLGLFGSGALGVVWIRMEISEVASSCGRLEDEREIVNRRVRDLRGRRAGAMRPMRLAQLVSGRLEMPPSSHRFHVTKEEMRRRLGGLGDSPITQQGTLAGRFER